MRTTIRGTEVGPRHWAAGRNVAVALFTAGLLDLFFRVNAGQPVLGVPVRTNAEVRFSLTGETAATYVIEASTNLQTWTAALTNSGLASQRPITLEASEAQGYYRVRQAAAPRFRFALAARRELELVGNNVLVDSFDSADPNRSTGGLYDPVKAGDSALVVAQADWTNSLVVGNAEVYGYVITMPSGSIVLGPNGTVGSTAWHLAGHPGVQPGHWLDDLDAAFPAVQPPFTGGGFTPPVGTVGGEFYRLILGADPYELSTLSLVETQKMAVIGDATLYVHGNISISGLAAIRIFPGASLRLYAAGASASIGGSGVINETGNATNFVYYGLPSNSTLALSGGDSFVGLIYAPDTHLTAQRGGATPFHFSGACVARTLTLNGHVRFHYDEALQREQ